MEYTLKNEKWSWLCFAKFLGKYLFSEVNSFHKYNEIIPLNLSLWNRPSRLQREKYPLLWLWNLESLLQSIFFPYRYWRLGRGYFHGIFTWILNYGLHFLESFTKNVDVFKKIPWNLTFFNCRSWLQKKKSFATTTQSCKAVNNDKIR